jgi:hypothetical protein
MGKKDYKGTILDGRDSFDSWKMDLDDSLLSDDFMSYVTTEATDKYQVYQLQQTKVQRTSKTPLSRE